MMVRLRYINEDFVQIILANYCFMIQEIVNKKEELVKYVGNLQLVVGSRELLIKQ